MQREKSLFWRGRSDYPLVDTERCRQEFFWRANSLVLTGLSRSMPIRVVPASLLFSTQGVFSDTVTQGAAQIPSIGVVIQNTWVYAPKIPPLRFIVSTQRSSFARTLPAAPKISTPEQQKVLPAYIGQEHSVLGYKLVNYRCCCSIFQDVCCRRSPPSSDEDGDVAYGATSANHAGVPDPCWTLSLPHSRRAQKAVETALYQQNTRYGL